MNVWHGVWFASSRVISPSAYSCIRCLWWHWAFVCLHCFCCMLAYSLSVISCHCFGIMARLVLVVCISLVGPWHLADVMYLACNLVWSISSSLILDACIIDYTFGHHSSFHILLSSSVEQYCSTPLQKIKLPPNQRIMIK
jgi:hypothetical protein